MKKIVLAALAALASSAGPALAADMVAKARPVVAAPVPAWDIAFGSAIVSDYNFRGISQSNRRPSVSAYFEPRYNINPNLQAYVGLAGNSISFPNSPSAEIDIYGGLRSTLGALTLDVGAWYYWYPGGQAHDGLTAATPFLPNGNGIYAKVDFWEVYGKVGYAFNDNFSVGANLFYSPSWLNTGAPGTYLSGTSKYLFPALANGVQFYTSGEVGHYWIGSTKVDGAVFAFPVNLPDYTTWNVGVGWTYKVFTVDLRYYDTDLSKENCNILSADHTATGGGVVSPANPLGNQSKWCGAAFVAKLAVDLTLNTNIK